MQQIAVRSRTRTELVDITHWIQQAVSESKVPDGVCHVFIPHTTAGLTINENADPSVVHDILMELNKIVPFDDAYQHSEGNSAAHIKASLMGCTLAIPFEGGRLALGMWQGVYMCEFDGPRSRRVYVQVSGQPG